MIGLLISKVIGTKTERELKRLWPIVAQVNALEPAMAKLSDAELRDKTDELRRRIRESIGRAAPNDVDEPPLASNSSKLKSDPILEEALTEVLPEAFAVVREAGKRVLNMRHFDVQLIGERYCTRARSPR